MNRNEKKALFSFLLIYVGSSLLFLGVSLYVYYNKELKSLDRQCSIEMVSAAHQIRGDILKSYMNSGQYNPKILANPVLKFGLFEGGTRDQYHNTTDLAFNTPELWTWLSNLCDISIHNIRQFGDK